MADLVQPVCLTFVGCCANVFALEHVLQQAPNLGSLITLLQFAFVALQTLPSQLTFRRRVKILRADGEAVVEERIGWLPRFKTRKVPLRRWLVQVLLFFGVSWLNNYAFGFHIPVALHIIFRSGGLAVSMLTNYLLQGRRYRPAQVVAVLLVTGGIVLATLSAPPKGGSISGAGAAAVAQDKANGREGAGLDWVYVSGIGLLTSALVLSALMGIWQEKTYRLHGDVWQEGLFYSHFLSLPLFAPLFPSLPTTLSALAASSPPAQISLLPLLPPGGPSSLLIALGLDVTLQLPLPRVYAALAANVLTQAVCVTGVNQLSGRTSSLTTTLILTLRKAASLGLSIWWYQNGEAGSGLWVGGALVLVGTAVYSLGSSAPAAASTASKERSHAVAGKKAR